MRRLLANAAMAAFLVIAYGSPALAYNTPPPLARLRGEVHRLASTFPASSAVEIMDLSTGYSAGYNAGISMPAASTIKIPVMVEVFKELQAGAFDLHHRVELLARDKDYGSGDLCDEPAGKSYEVGALLSKMIDISDNTAANMLIRLVGRSHINQTMQSLGLDRTLLTQDVRTNKPSVRQTLRSSASDMVRLLSLMAHRSLIDAWSSSEMISILEDDQINTLLPEPLPDDVAIAHKTGSFFDTLNDVGIVFENDAPYVIAVMTTHLPSLSAGRAFIRSLSKMAFTNESRLAIWRDSVGLQAFAASGGIMPPDVRYWQNSESDATTGGG